jgi:hypothetical protein
MGTMAFPFWTALICHLAIGIETLAGGRRIIKSMAMKLTRLRPYQEACAEAAAAISLLGTSEMGIAVSTTTRASIANAAIQDPSRRPTSIALNTRHGPAWRSPVSILSILLSKGVRVEHKTHLTIDFTCLQQSSPLAFPPLWL